jgi:DNA-binding NtrC family response regulator
MKEPRVLENLEMQARVPADLPFSLERMPANLKKGSYNMPKPSATRLHALLFGLSEDLAGELLQPLAKICTNVKSLNSPREMKNLKAADSSAAEVIFCGPDVEVVSTLRAARPQAPIVVVSRHPEVKDWLDSIEAGATDYCAAPFETSQVRWILESSMRQNGAIV